MLTLLFCMAAAIILVWPDTTCGRTLRRLMIELPARTLTPGAVLFALLVMLAIAVVIGLARGDGVFLVAQGVPEGIAWFATFEVATYLDVIALAWLLAATVRLRAAYDALKAAAARARRLAVERAGALRLRSRMGARDRSRRGARRTPPPSRDDEPAWSGLTPSYA